MEAILLFFLGPELMEPTWGIRENSVLLPTGTNVSLSLDGYRGLPLTRSEIGGVVNVYFPMDDVNFSIVVNNKNVPRPLIYEVILDKERKNTFLVDEYGWLVNKTLRSNGRRFHFVSQETDEGRDIVFRTAEKYGISYDEAKDFCSKIELRFEAGTVQLEREVDWSVDSCDDYFFKKKINDRDDDRGAICLGNFCDQKYTSVQKPKIDKKVEISPITFVLRISDDDSTT